MTKKSGGVKLLSNKLKYQQAPPWTRGGAAESLGDGGLLRDVAVLDGLRPKGVQTNMLMLWYETAVNQNPVNT
jgi:hypothetical protein